MEDCRDQHAAAGWADSASVCRSGSTVVPADAIIRAARVGIFLAGVPLAATVWFFVGL